MIPDARRHTGSKLWRASVTTGRPIVGGEDLKPGLSGCELPTAGPVPPQGTTTGTGGGSSV
jgi:hypothetical protein